MSKPKILLFSGQGWISKLIRWQTNGKYSHAAILIPGGSIIEAWHKPAKVRFRPPLKNWKGVEAYEVEGMTDEQWAKALLWADKQVGKPYDFGGVARFITRWRKQKDEKWFCSELVFQAVKEGGVDLLSRIECSQVSPTVLSFSPFLKKVSLEGIAKPPKAIPVDEL